MKSFTLICGFFASVILNFCLTDAAEPKNYALLIAVTKYQHAELNKPSLSYPEADAKSVGQFLAQQGYEVEYLLGDEATKERIETKLTGLSRKGNQEGVLFLGLWGHGVEFHGTKETMFCPFDATIRLALDADKKQLFDNSGKRLVEPDPNSLVGMSTFLDGMRICGTGSRILVADCCRTSPNRARGRAFGANVSQTDIPENTLALFACKADQQAIEHDDWGHGAMTMGLLESLPTLAGREDGYAVSLIAPMTTSVSNMVQTVSNGREKQTIHPILNGNPKLVLKSSDDSELWNDDQMDKYIIQSALETRKANEATSDTTVAVALRNEFKQLYDFLATIKCFHLNYDTSPQRKRMLEILKNNESALATLPTYDHPSNTVLRWLVWDQFTESEREFLTAILTQEQKDQITKELARPAQAIDQATRKARQDFILQLSPDRHMAAFRSLAHRALRDRYWQLQMNDQLPINLRLRPSLDVLLECEGVDAISRDQISYGKLTVVQFSAFTWCPPCKLTLKQWPKIQEELGDKYQFVVVSRDEDVADTRRILAENNIKATVVTSASIGLSARPLAVAAIPAVFVFGSDGKLITPSSSDRYELVPRTDEYREKVAQELRKLTH